MNDREQHTPSLDDLELLALGASGTILFCFVVYWALEIQSVLEMLELAYG